MYPPVGFLKRDPRDSKRIQVGIYLLKGFIINDKGKRNLGIYIDVHLYKSQSTELYKTVNGKHDLKW